MFGMAAIGCGEAPLHSQARAQTSASQPSGTPAPQTQPSGTGSSQPATDTKTETKADPKADAKAGPKGDSVNESAKSDTIETALFGAGCFWGVEHIFRNQVPGVVEAVSGYSGGKTKNPTYQEVCNEPTGHAEVVRVKFDTTKTSYKNIVDAFFRLHDPTQVNRQGPDIGDQYRTVIFYYSPQQKQIAEEVKAARAPKYSKPIATTIEPAQEFYRAEEYHQRYYEKTGKQPYCHVLLPE